MIQMNQFAGQEQRRRRREWTRGHQGQGDGGMNWEIKTDIYTLPCVKQIASWNLLYSTGSSAAVGVCVGRRSEKEGIYVYTQLIHFTAQQKLTHCKATMPQLKKEQGSSLCSMIWGDWMILSGSEFLSCETGLRGGGIHLLDFGRPTQDNVWESSR